MSTKITGRVEMNNGSFAVIELTNGNYLNITRGHSYGFRDLFADEFLRMLPVKSEITATLLKKGVHIEPCSGKAERVARTIAR
jgi:hypothetical protein